MVEFIVDDWILKVVGSSVIYIIFVEELEYFVEWDFFVCER